MNYHIYWADLKPETQEDLIDNGFNPDDQNLDDNPIGVLVIGDPDS